MKREIKVIISFDAEFSINGAFSDPFKKSPSSKQLFSPKDSSDLGLQEILSILKKNNAPATFFTEALNTHYFDINEMGRYARSIFEHGHDVQLHAHPCWLTFKNPDWQHVVKGQKISDTFAGMSLEEISHILDYCLEIFEHWGVPRPIAFRAGNLFAVRSLYKALKIKKFNVASNVSLAIHTPKDPELIVENTSTKLDDIIELPVTTFASMGFRQKSLTITGTSYKELTDVLKECQTKDIDYVVVLTHIHEYIKYSPKNSDVRRNRVNVNRLDKFCSYVNKHPNFSFTTFGELLNNKDFLNKEHHQPSKIIKTNTISGAITIIENFLNDRIWKF